MDIFNIEFATADLHSSPQGRSRLNRRPNEPEHSDSFTMPVSRAAGLRPAGALQLPRQCASTTSPSLSPSTWPSTRPPHLVVLRLQSTSTRCRQQKSFALLIVPTGTQFRYKSTAPPDQNSESSGSKAGQTPKPSPSLKGMLWQAIKSDSSRAWYVIRNTSFTEVMRRNPFEALGAVVAYVPY